MIASVVAGTAAEKAGLQKGDVILSVSGKDVSTFDDLRAIIVSSREGDEIELRISRDGAERTVKVKLGARSQD
jgi:S1-C subfamily serine protease